MGIIVHGIPLWSLEFAKEMGINEAWETGTYTGNSAELMSSYFQTVSTVEADYDIYVETKQRLGKNSKISFFHGDSPNFLAKSPREIPVLFWLDAHYSGDNTSGESAPCPVIDEIKVLGALGVHDNSVIFIDDARLFSLPHDLAPRMEGWPSLHHILDLLREFGYSTFISDDVLVAVKKLHFASFCDFVMKKSLWKPINQR